MPPFARTAVRDVCHDVADALVADGRLLTSIYLHRGGRLRLQTARGYGQVYDGIPPSAGLIGRVYQSGEELVLADVGETDDYLEAAPGMLATACLPLRAGGETIGVLSVESAAPLDEPELERIRALAGRLERRIGELGGAPEETPTERLARHASQLASLDDVDAAEDHILDAALDISPLDSALLVMAKSDGTLEPRHAIGPLCAVLWTLPQETLSELAGLVKTGASCSSRDDRGGQPLASVEKLQAGGAGSMIAIGLSAPGGTSGLLLLAARRQLTITTEEIELLELLAAHGASCLRTAGLVAELRERAATDPLTGLGHSATFAESLAARNRDERAVLMIDVDGFKSYNDTFGHQAGDRILRETAAALTRALRRDDQLFRIGGDEFAAIVRVTGGEDTLEVGRRLRETLRDSPVTVSIGAAIPRPGESDDSVIKRADRALYAVKEAGRDGVLVDGEEPGTDPLFVG